MTQAAACRLRRSYRRKLFESRQIKWTRRPSKIDDGIEADALDDVSWTKSLFL
jgi:hypothetical protein